MSWSQGIMIRYVTSSCKLLAGEYIFLHGTVLDLHESLGSGLKGERMQGNGCEMN
jgi:hypothetical protein